MNLERGLAGLRVPTLTEVVARAEPGGIDVRLDEAAGPGEASVLAAPPQVAVVPRPEDAAPQTPLQAPMAAQTEPDLMLNVLADVQRQVELMLEYRLRETLAPILARATDSVIRDARTQLASTLHEMVARAVALELSRHRHR